MPNITPGEYINYLRKQAAEEGNGQPTRSVELEADLHREIIDYCNSKWPRWKYRHARMDKRTTEELGVEDFTIFAPNNKTFHIEAKARNEKLSEDQLIWQKEMEMLGRTVHIVRSMDDFRKIIE